ncbi:MAG: hypothetical protein KKA05_10305 [Alphaproteobacteria bacterium]|nr:hypothetical protein [Alphaproteobacteria bacterium]
MAIVLNANDLAECASQFPEDAPICAALASLEAAATALAALLAEREGVTQSGTAETEPGFGGLCATFQPGPDGKTSARLAAYDVGGDWE